MHVKEGVESGKNIPYLFWEAFPHLSGVKYSFLIQLKRRENLGLDGVQRKGKNYRITEVG